MRDLRRRALESHKTVSRKAKAKVDKTSRTSSAANSRSASRHASDDEDSNASDSTNFSTGSFGDIAITDLLLLDEQEDNDETFAEWKQKVSDRSEEIIDRKRTSVQSREATLEAWVHLLRSNFAKDEIRSKTSELLPSMFKSIKAESSEKETCFALKAVEITIATMQSDTVYEAVFKVLKNSYTHSESPSIKTAAIHALGTAAMLGGASEEEMEEIMDNLLEIIESDGTSIEAEDNGEVVAAAIEEWALLATFVEDMEDKTEEAMEVFVGQLESSDVGVQVASGEAIALLFEKSYTEREEFDEPATEVEEGDTNFVKRYEVYRQRNQLMHMLSQLAKEASKSISKKKRQTLHVNFRDIFNTVENPTRGPRYSKAVDAETGQEYGSRMILGLPQGAMRIDKWWKLHRLQALKRILGAGLLNHYMNNDAVFDVLPYTKPQDAFDLLMSEHH